MIHLDYETYSPLDLTEVGVFRYAEDPEAEILMCAVATETEGPFLLVNPKWESVRASDPEARRIVAAIWPSEPVEGEEVWAHNAQFEFAISRAMLERQFGVHAPQVEQWRCTALLCRRAGLPPSLDKACEVLKLPHQKDAKGKALIKKFSMPDPKTGKRTLPTDDPEAFRQFCGYCLQDVRAERALHAALKPFTPTGDLLAAFTWDLVVNARGFPVDVPALEKAQKLIDEVRGEVAVQFKALTGLAPSQRQACLQWFNDHGLVMENMQGATVTAMLAEPKWEGDKACAQEDRSEDNATLGALHLYSLVQSAAVDKVQTMLDCVCADGRVRGGLQFHGASTGRWSGRLVQPQNFKKPRYEHGPHTDAFFADLRAGYGRAELETLYGPVIDWTASSIRHFLSGPLLDADYSAIEARGVAWLAGEESILRKFRKGEDLYMWMASKVYGIPEDKLDRKKHRQLGKVTILGCGYQMWWPKFKDTAKTQYGLDLTDEMAEKAVVTYRNAFPKITGFWEACESAIRQAITSPGSWFKAGQHVAFIVKKVGEVPFLLARLPSARVLAYPWPMLEEDPKRHKVGISFYGQLPKSVRWGRVFTFGGSVTENLVQALSFDLMAYGARQAEAAGFEVVNLIHDQALALHKEGQLPTAFAAALTTLPPWAAGLPLTAEAAITPYYTK